MLTAMMGSPIYFVPFTVDLIQFVINEKMVTVPKLVNNVIQTFSEPMVLIIVYLRYAGCQLEM